MIAGRVSILRERQGTTPIGGAFGLGPVVGGTDFTTEFTEKRGGHRGGIKFAEVSEAG